LRSIDTEWGTMGATIAITSVAGSPAALLPSYSLLDLNASIT
jgi:hypothetical protein